MHLRAAEQAGDLRLRPVGAEVELDRRWCAATATFTTDCWSEPLEDDATVVVLAVA